MKSTFLVIFILLLKGTSISEAQQAHWLKYLVDTPQKESKWIQYEGGQHAGEFLDSLGKAYQEEGYLELNLVVDKIGADSSLVKLTMGMHYYWQELKWGNVPEDFVPDDLPLTLSYSDAAYYMNGVLDKAENNGYPFAQVKVDSIVRSGNKLCGVIDYQAGPLILWDSVIVSGDTKTRSRYIQNLTGIKPGEPFSQKEWIAAARILDHSPYFYLSSPPELSFQIQKARPNFRLKDRSSNRVDGIIGLIPSENGTGKMLITGQLNLALYNLGGKGRDVEVHWQRVNVESQSLELGAKEAFVFNSPLDVSLVFNLLKQDTTFLNRSFRLEFGYHLARSGYLRFFTRRQGGDLISTVAYREVTELPDVADYRWNQYGIGWILNQLDSPYFPHKGFLLSGEMAAGNKRILENTGIPSEVYVGIDLNSPQYQAQIEFEQHVYLRPIWGMRLKGSGGFTQNENLFLNDLYRLGGLKTIRGFNENFFYAKSYAYMNVEQRIFFGENSFLMVFADLGILENPYFAAPIDKPISFGAGINLDTGTGVFQFIYGVGKSDLQPLQFSYSRIHFGYLARF